MLRSLRLGEADRVLHLYTLERGRIGAVAKGIRRTKSRFGARLEPLSHVEVMLHQGAGELQTVTGRAAERSHHSVREDGYRLSVGLVGAEAMLRLFGEPEANPRAFEALTKFLDLLDELPERLSERPALDPLALSFQLKLLWLSGYLPHLTSCANCGGWTSSSATRRRRAGRCATRAARGRSRCRRPGRAGIELLLSTPLADAAAAGLTDRGEREALAVITASYEFHGGFRLRTLRSA